MRYGIFSDIHSNIDAFEAVLDSIAKERPDQLLCVGDIVGYGARPKECLTALKEHNIISVAGNHDWAVGGRLDYGHFTHAAKKAVDWTRDQLSFEEREHLSQLSEIYQTEKLTLVHGTLNSPSDFNYCRDVEDAQDTFFLMKSPVCFIGHTHIPLIFSRKGTVCSYANSLDLIFQPEMKYIVNVGSVGQPRDGNPHASYVIFDDEAMSVSIKRVSYDVKAAQSKILEAGLPETLALRLTVGA